ncbi:MAG: hypothetical protein FWG68_02285 [Defluviitaleaceae bacterium]|nr:hypothetical protein [Defluviitaleaceae bacterium]
MDYKSRIRKICIAFVVMLVGLTFFSQTLADLRLPRVSLAFFETQAVGPEATLTGIVRHATVSTIFAPVEGTIIEIAPLGDSGPAETVLFTVHSDFSRLQELIDQANHEQYMISLNVTRVNQEIALEQQLMAQATQAPPPILMLSLMEYDLQLESNAQAIERAQADLAEQQHLFEQGLIPYVAVADRETTVAMLEQAREQLYTRRILAVENHAIQVEQQQEERERIIAQQIQSHQASISRLNMQLLVHAAETENVQQRINQLILQMAEGGFIEVYAETPYTVLEIMPGLTVGARVAEGQPVMITAVQDNNFVIEAAFAAQQDFISVGSNATIELTDNTINASVQRIFAQQGGLTAVMEVNSPLLLSGQALRVTIAGNRSFFSMAVPRSALREDNMGYYIMFVEAEERPFGMDYFAETFRAFNVIARDDDFVALGMNPPMPPPPAATAPIIVNSDLPITQGDRVRPVAGGDFIATR